MISQGNFRITIFILIFCWKTRPVKSSNMGQSNCSNTTSSNEISPEVLIRRINERMRSYFSASRDIYSWNGCFALPF